MKNQFVSKVVFMENAKHQTIVIVKLVGRVKIVQFVWHCLDVFTDIVRDPMNVFVNQVGLAHIVMTVSLGCVHSAQWLEGCS